MVAKRRIIHVTASFLCLLIVTNVLGVCTPVHAGSSHTINVKGRLTFRGKPIKNAVVRVYDSDDVPPDELKAEGYTDDSGRFSFTGVDNVDYWIPLWGDVTGIDVYVRCYARNYAVDVVGNPGWLQEVLCPWPLPDWVNGETWYFSTPTWDDREDGSTLDMGTQEASPRTAEAFSIFDIINQGHEFLRAMGAYSPQVTVFWDDWFTPGESWCCPRSIPNRPELYTLDPTLAWLFTFVIDPMTIAYGKAEQEIARSIIGLHIKVSDGWQPDRVLHEYGHWVMDTYADLWPPDTVLDHYPLTAYNPEHAWAEGWAHFFSAAARDWSGYSNPQTGNGFNIEEKNYEGSSVEAAVAGILWDIYDSHQEANDTLAMGFGPIFDVLKNYDPNPGGSGHHHPWTIFEFWDGLYSRQGDAYTSQQARDNISGMWRIYYLHGIAFTDNDPPINPTFYKTSHIPRQEEASNIIVLWMTPAIDYLSGAEYAVVWDNNPDTIPTESDFTPTYKESSGAQVNYFIQSPPLSDGNNWYVHVRARDYAGNWAEGTFHDGPFYINYPIKISITPSTATLQATLGSSVTYAVSITNYGSTDTLDMNASGYARLNFSLDSEAVTIESGQTLAMNLTVTLKESPPIFLGDFPFWVTAHSPLNNHTAQGQGIVSVGFTPVLPETPTGGLAITVQRETVYTSSDFTRTGDVYFLRTNISLVNNQNFDDVITVDLIPRGSIILFARPADPTWLVEGDPEEWENYWNLGWSHAPSYSWWRTKVVLPAYSSMDIALGIEIPVTTSPGIYLFNIEAVSRGRPTAATIETVTIHVVAVRDITSPTTTISMIGTSRVKGWYVSDVTVEFRATDDLSGVALTEYGFDGANWIHYTGAITISSEGTTTIYYRSIDHAGNVEPTKTATFILDKTPPTTTLVIGEPRYISDQTYVTQDTPFTLEATDAGSGVYSTAYRINNATYDSDWQTYTAPFKLTSLTDGTYTIEYNSTDNAGNVEIPHTVSVVLDNTGPIATVFNPPSGWALQDGVTFIISAADVGSGVHSVNASIRIANGGEGQPCGFEDLPATYDKVTGKWTVFFNTLQLPDGYYTVLVETDDNLGNIGSPVVVPYSIRNWVVIQLLPSTPKNKAGRTMPIKFSLRVAAAVDPTQPFVYNEELIIKIYATNNPSTIFQTSTYGDGARNYRIDVTGEKYITNFKTLSTPKQYTVSVNRNTFIIGSFTFQTVA